MLTGRNAARCFGQQVLIEILGGIQLSPTVYGTTLLFFSFQNKYIKKCSVLLFIGIFKRKIIGVSWVVPWCGWPIIWMIA